MKEVNEVVDKLVKNWNDNDLTVVAYEITNLYNTAEYSFLIDVMHEFKKRIISSFETNSKALN